MMRQDPKSIEAAIWSIHQKRGYSGVDPDVAAYLQQHTYEEYQREQLHSIIADLDSQGLAFEGRVLDLGCGYGALVKLLSERCNAIGIDPDRETLNVGGLRGISSRLLQGAAEHLPLKDGSLDSVISLTTLEHTLDEVRALQEAIRALRNGGFLYLIAPNYSSFREDHYNLRWLPYLPGGIQKLYLRFRGRWNTAYLDSLNLIRKWKVKRVLKSLPGVRVLDMEMVRPLRKLRNPGLIQHAARRRWILRMTRWPMVIGLVEALIRWKQRILPERWMTFLVIRT